MPSSQTNIELNEQFIKVLDLMESSVKNIFITGKAGTGKSTLLKHFREITKKYIAVLVPTGTAAVNINGQTIHSFFGFKPDVRLESIKASKKDSNKKKDNIYKNLDALIIDEISMVRADLLDCIDKFLRLNGKEIDKPFGDLQIIFIADLYQVPSKKKQIFKSHYPTPRVIVTDKLRSYIKPIKYICPKTEHRSHKGLNNRVENAHQPTRRKEKILIKCKSANSAQSTLSLMNKIRNISAIDVRRYSKTASEQRVTFESAKTIWDKAAQRLLAA